MVLPIEIQNLILTRYYFNQWKEKIEKINQQYHQSFIYEKNKIAECLALILYNNNVFFFNNRPLNKNTDPYSSDAHVGIVNWKLFLKNIHPNPKPRLPKKYFFSSGYPEPNNIPMNMYKYVHK